MRLYKINGAGKSKSKMHYKLYNVWYKMHQRCSNTNNKDYCRYGELGISVDIRWRVFEKFVEDVQKLNGWDLDEFMNSKIQLDKDKLQVDKPKSKQVYSIDTCLWLTPCENKQIQTSQQDKFIAISPDNKIYYGRNKYRFCVKHNMHEGNMHNALSGKTDSYKGWLIKYEKDGWNKENLIKYKEDNFDIKYSNKNNLQKFSYWICDNEGNIFKIGHIENFCKENDLPISLFQNGYSRGDSKKYNNSNEWYSYNISGTTKDLIDWMRFDKKPKYIAISPENTRHYFSNVSKFMRDINLNRNAIYNVLNGKRPNIKGWNFYLY